ncbi:meiosis-specific cyclin Rem1-like [Schizosaccharomyces osmophilus]|uniref:Meiosis-specific cyclin Rem1-like n=1 Tax=Schizosaccharomyces osmophilus TaxID=2545709 RepID=A0AAE9W956_9SCHI|nr:meiosis-specific cyclin Rem1-like [Schizosaccharomyces osmophilus]WBW71969.1 meiosis-specific cyclin Rem1-like [Schizosaccharomyces osmophilus]
MKTSLERQALKEISNREKSNAKNSTTVKVKEIKPLLSDDSEARHPYSEERGRSTTREEIKNQFKDIFFPYTSNDKSILEEAIDLTFQGIESDEAETSPEDILEDISEENTFIDETEVESYIEEKLKSDYEADTTVSVEYAKEIFCHMKHLEVSVFK